MVSRPPVLLTAGFYYGTLAAARCLGRAGVKVTLAEGQKLAPARWSRHVDRRVLCPDPSDTEAFLSWLSDFGANNPRHVLLPCTDEVAWLVAESSEQLSRHFYLQEVPFSAVDGVLDKRALHAACEAASVDVPLTRFPESEAEAVKAGEEIGYPLILKPRTQVLLSTHGKGLLVEEPTALVSRFREYVAENHYGDRIQKRIKNVAWPMLQRYYPKAREGIYGLSGFAGEGGEILAVRGARKILQRPRRLGIGLCFEEAPVDPARLSAVQALCRSLSYQGVFEVEMVEDGSRSVLIDFNPRFYSQMAFDIDRGLALPRFAYAAAMGDREALSALAQEAESKSAPSGRVYCNRLMFQMMLRGQRLGGHLTKEEQAKWRSWWSEHKARATDSVVDRQDLAPFAADLVSIAKAAARHPRSFLRSLMRDQ